VDAQGADSNLKDNLMLMAGPGDDRMWAKELARFLRAEQKERDKIQAERATRLRHWRQNVAPTQ